MSNIFFEMPEEMLKQATLIASRYPDKSILSIIEECFNYGAKSLYTDAPKPVLKEIKEPDFKQEVPNSLIRGIHSLSASMANSSQDEIYSSYEEDDIPESYGTPIITEKGLFEL